MTIRERLFRTGQDKSLEVKHAAWGRIRVVPGVICGLIIWYPTGGSEFARNKEQAEAKIRTKVEERRKQFRADVMHHIIDWEGVYV